MSFATDTPHRPTHSLRVGFTSSRCGPPLRIWQRPCCQDSLVGLRPRSGLRPGPPPSTAGNPSTGRPLGSGRREYASLVARSRRRRRPCRLLWAGTLRLQSGSLGVWCSLLLLPRVPYKGNWWPVAGGLQEARGVRLPLAIPRQAPRQVGAERKIPFAC